MDTSGLNLPRSVSGLLQTKDPLHKAWHHKPLVLIRPDMIKGAGQHDLHTVTVRQHFRHHLLGHPGHSVGADRRQRHVFPQRKHILRHIAVLLGRSHRQYPAAFHAVPAQSFRQIQKNPGVVVETLRRMFPAVSHTGKGCQMQYLIRAECRNHILEGLLIQQVHLAKSDLENPVISVKIKFGWIDIHPENLTLFSLSVKIIQKMPSHKPGKSGNQNLFHEIRPLFHTFPFPIGPGRNLPPARSRLRRPSAPGKSFWSRSCKP